jgi:hypothetical protein
MRNQALIRTALFITAYTVGLAAIVGAILADDILEHFQLRTRISRIRQANQKLRQISEDYQNLIELIENDPAVLSRLDILDRGTEPNDPNSPIPPLNASQLNKAREVLKNLDQKAPTDHKIPARVMRLTDSRVRLILFICGAALTMLSFTCFRNVNPPDSTEKAD